MLPRVSMESSWSLRGVSVESSRSPCGFFVDSTESSWTPWKPVGECKALQFPNKVFLSFGNITRRLGEIDSLVFRYCAVEESRVDIDDMDFPVQDCCNSKQ